MMTIVLWTAFAIAIIAVLFVYGLLLLSDEDY
jgi:hypothetical protein